jgi:hypothetical protein
MYEKINSFILVKDFCNCYKGDKFRKYGTDRNRERVRDLGNIYQISDGNRKGKDHMEDLGVHGGGGAILKCILNKKCEDVD